MSEAMLLIEKGRTYPGALPETDTIIAEFCRNGHHLLVALEAMSPTEIKAFQAPVKAGLLYSNGVILTLWQFPLTPVPCWMDAPFNARVIPPEHYTPVEIASPETRIAIQYTLADRATRVVHSIRYFTLDPTFTRFFARACHWQLDRDRAVDFDTELNRLYQDTTAALLRRADYVGRVGE